MGEIIIKTPEQIEGIRRSCRLAASALHFISPYVQPGVSTGRLDKLLDTYIRDHGATPAPLGFNGYPKSTCISVNEVVCHGIPSDQEVIHDGDIVNIDVSTVLDGYYGDTSTMFAVGDISEQAAWLLGIARRSMNAGISEVKPGNRFGNIGHRIWTFASLHGCTVVEEFAGHGVGLEFHEPPAVPHISLKNTGPYMRTGMIFTVEPMLNLGGHQIVIAEDGWTARTADGKLSAQFEHTVLVTETGVEVLT